jgi:hypothetical protein
MHRAHYSKFLAQVTEPQVFVSASQAIFQIQFFPFWPISSTARENTKKDGSIIKRRCAYATILAAKAYHSSSVTFSQIYKIREKVRLLKP